MFPGQEFYVLPGKRLVAAEGNGGAVFPQAGKVAGEHMLGGTQDQGFFRVKFLVDAEGLAQCFEVVLQCVFGFDSGDFIDQFPGDLGLQELRSSNLSRPSRNSCRVFAVKAALSASKASKVLSALFQLRQ